MRDLKTTDIVYLPGVGPARSKLLKEQLNVHTWHDLLYYFPYKHIDTHACTKSMSSLRICRLCR